MSKFQLYGSVIFVAICLTLGYCQLQKNRDDQLFYAFYGWVSETGNPHRLTFDQWKALYGRKVGKEDIK